MSVLVDSETRLAVAGITGKEGAFHTLNNRRYGTNVVGGVTPGKGGQDVEGIPVFDSWEQAAAEVKPNTAMIFVPPRFAADSILEAAAAGVELVIAITEGIPAHDELRVYNTLQQHPGTRLVGPNCPGILSPGKANVGIIPASFFSEGNVGVVSRSGTLTYQIGNEIAQAGFGCSSIVGIGGDPVPGSSFVDILELFQQDEQTELIVLSGEIGGSAEEEAAEYIAEHVSKPVVAYIAGFTAPPGKQMGHAGAIVSGSAGTAAAKAQALEAKDVRVGRTPTEVAAIAVEILGGASALATARRQLIQAPRRPPEGAAERPCGQARPLRLVPWSRTSHRRSARSSASLPSWSARWPRSAATMRRPPRHRPPRHRPPPAARRAAAVPATPGTADRPCRGRDGRAPLAAAAAAERSSAPPPIRRSQPRRQRAPLRCPTRRWRRAPRRRARPVRQATPSCSAFADGSSRCRASSPMTTTSCSDA